MIDIQTKTVPADARGIAEAARILRQGGLVAFPTETVYGLGADATNGQAVAAIFAAKGRPLFNPLIVHVEGIEEARRHVELSPRAQALAEKFWPGPLTLVLPRRKNSPLSLLVSAGQVTATTAQHVADSLGGKVDLILDAGSATLGIESTVIGFDGDRPLLLRPGAIAREEIEDLVGPLGPPGNLIQSPGQLASHYAPRAGLRLNAGEIESGEVLLGFGDVKGAKLNLSPRGDLREAAANLFAMLRELDKVASQIAVSPIPDTGIGEAINDRLRRAAAPR
jgi:L-threonylcarbamoyladenylate synthase